MKLGWPEKILAIILIVIFAYMLKDCFNAEPVPLVPIEQEQAP